jgi:hypothetical protein
MPTPDQLYDDAINKRDSGDKPAAIELLKQAAGPEICNRAWNDCQALCGSGRSREGN